MTVIIGLVGVVLGGLIGAVTSYVTNRSSMLIELEHSYDVALRDKRLERYQVLFHLSECIPRRWRPGTEPTRARLLEFWNTFHDWYFGPDAGGMFLTKTAKACYLNLQNALIDVAREDTTGTPSAEPLTEAESRLLRSLASELRHQLAEDVGASHPPRLRWSRVDKTVEGPEPTTIPVP
ncbi:hypothetical protein FBY35_0359 [Streptomyces sp. SLBN-118]|uniref:hypothetical protein n=1 Tax=Streptomyces sp. SLBN-118 TaxID=2768454 RepID=UPI00114F0F58|nr:hypothetical protein [Streptomyces sp. SLBN-118]TQK50060.1 hypothetical protein FBY35_0359 [Streptomyces sp. SLBN-118]